MEKEKELEKLVARLLEQFEVTPKSRNIATLLYGELNEMNVYLRELTASVKEIKELLKSE